jgi:signal transduction histidine kinase
MFTPQLAVVYFTPDVAAVALVRELLEQNGLSARLVQAASPVEFAQAIEDPQTGLILAEETGVGPELPRVFSMARERWPEIPCLCLTNRPEVAEAPRWFTLGADDCLSLQSSTVCLAALRRGLKMAKMLQEKKRWQQRGVGTSRLLKAMQDLSEARDLPTVQKTVAAAERDVITLAGTQSPELLETLTDIGAVAIANVRMYAELEQRVKDRTRLLEETNRELESFSFSVSHDLRSPLSAIMAYADLLRETLGSSIDPDVKEACQRIVQQSHRMNGLIRDLLRLGQVSRAELKRQRVDLSEMAREKLQHMAEIEPTRSVEVRISDDLVAEGDPSLLGVVLENLLSNAWKYTGKCSAPLIEFGAETPDAGGVAFFVRDNGAGFNSRQADRLFAPFQRLHRQDEFPGVGVGLATVQRVVHKHGGRVWAKSAVGEGATFYFTLPTAAPLPAPSAETQIKPATNPGFVELAR